MLPYQPSTAETRRSAPLPVSKEQKSCKSKVQIFQNCCFLSNLRKPLCAFAFPYLLLPPSSPSPCSKPRVPQPWAPPSLPALPGWLRRQPVPPLDGLFWVGGTGDARAPGGGG